MAQQAKNKQSTQNYSQRWLNLRLSKRQALARCLEPSQAIQSGHISNFRRAKLNKQTSWKQCRCQEVGLGASDLVKSRTIVSSQCAKCTDCWRDRASSICSIMRCTMAPGLSPIPVISGQQRLQDLVHRPRYLLILTHRSPKKLHVQVWREILWAMAHWWELRRWLSGHRT